MPFIKQKVEGVEYGFAPLKLKELRAVKKMKATGDAFERLDEWMPFLKSSVERGALYWNGLYKYSLPEALPDLDEMDLDAAGLVFAGLIAGVMKASGMELAIKGEAAPVVESELIGTTSTDSSSPLPAGV